MPQEPKKRHSKARKGTRRAAIILKSIALVKCANCGQPTKPHTVCGECGYYGKKKIAAKQVQVTKA